jgi:YidC/Oxa1 family membrane protein insertase
MAEPSGKKSRYLDYAIAFVLVYVLSQLVMRQFFPAAPTADTMVVTLQPQSINVRLGAAANTIIVKNTTAQTLTLSSRCPEPPFDVFSVTDSQTPQEKITPLVAGGTVIPCAEIPALEPLLPGKSMSVALNPWKYSLFAHAGTYEVRLPASVRLGSGAALNTASGEAISTRFRVVEPNGFIKIFRAVITKPFLNFLVLVASILPDHNLGVGIIILTILVKFLLFIPTQHALEGQKKMQLLQPKLEAVKKQYKDNPQRMQEETIKLWKEHKVNPLQSCLPILVQFPVLIGLFYVIRDNASLAMSQELLYPAYQHLSWNFSTQFLGLDLTLPNVWIFPPLLVVMQFLQMKLSFVIADKKKAQQIEKAEAATGLEMQQKVMLYVLPFMIGFFALKFPSAVSLYWGISTLFAIGQQMIVNREHIKA